MEIRDITILYNFLINFCLFRLVMYLSHLRNWYYNYCTFLKALDSLNKQMHQKSTRQTDNKSNQTKQLFLSLVFIFNFASFFFNLLRPKSKFSFSSFLGLLSVWFIYCKLLKEQITHYIWNKHIETLDVKPADHLLFLMFIQMVIKLC